MTACIFDSHVCYFCVSWARKPDLVHCKGFKKVDFYMRKQKELELMKQEVNAEELEAINVNREMELEMLEPYQKVDRVLDMRFAACILLGCAPLICIFTQSFGR